MNLRWIPQMLRLTWRTDDVVGYWMQHWDEVLYEGVSKEIFRLDHPLTFRAMIVSYFILTCDTH